jgi:hypothetical protein
MTNIHRFTGKGTDYICGTYPPGHLGTHTPTDVTCPLCRERQGLTAPTVHINGTSRDELLGQLETAAAALNTAIEKLSNAAPNGRDYYPQGPRAWARANDEHVARLGKLQSVYEELQALWQAIYVQP